MTRQHAYWFAIGASIGVTAINLIALWMGGSIGVSSLGLAGGAGLAYVLAAAERYLADHDAVEIEWRREAKARADFAEQLVQNIKAAHSFNVTVNADDELPQGRKH